MPLRSMIPHEALMPKRQMPCGPHIVRILLNHFGYAGALPRYSRELLQLTGYTTRVSLHRY
jgi:hypothetical protein